MAIRKIRVSNFRSFSDLEIELGKLNIMIGPNASGKSNFIEIFKFLRDVSTLGLENSLSLQGGIEYLRNVRIGSSKKFSMHITYDMDVMSLTKREKLIGVKPSRMMYEFAMDFVDEGNFEISKDEFTGKYEFFDVDERSGYRSWNKLGEGEIILSHVGKKLNCYVHLGEGVPLENDDLIPPFLSKIELSPKTLLLETPFFSTIPPFEKVFDTISFYDFDPKLSKKAVPMTGKMELEETGSNLAIVLRNILKDEEQKRKFSNLLKDLLPFLEDVDVEKFMDKSLLLKSRETYAETYLPAFLLSDGTISIIALIIALNFEEKPFVIIEEPERNIHPSLISRVMDMFKDTSKGKQIMVTTHNPEVLKHADLKDILLISRGEDGFSTISRPVEEEGVRTFLEHEIGIEELYVQNLLGV